jgi:hypothetical protein
MDSHKKKPAFLRYFKSRLRPFAQFKVWGSLGILALVGLSIWQYQKHPEWLSPTIEQPDVSGDFLGDDLSDPLAESNLSAPEFDLGMESNSLQSPLLEDPLNSETSLPTLPLDKAKSKASKSENVFAPVGQFPSAQGNEQSEQSLFPLPFNLKSYRPLLPNQSKSQSTLSVSKPRETSPAVQNSFTPKVVSSSGNPLTKAIEQLLSPAPLITTPTATPANPNSLSQPGNNNFPPQSTQVQSPIQPYQSPYNNYPLQPPAQSQVQPYQSPYNNYPLQPPAQSQVQPYQSPYNNYPGQSVPGQLGQSRNNPSPVQTPQIQPPIQIDNPNF